MSTRVRLHGNWVKHDVSPLIMCWFWTLDLMNAPRKTGGHLPQLALSPFGQIVWTWGSPTYPDGDVGYGPIIEVDLIIGFLFILASVLGARSPRTL